MASRSSRVNQAERVKVRIVLFVDVVVDVQAVDKGGFVVTRTHRQVMNTE